MGPWGLWICWDRRLRTMAQSDEVRSLVRGLDEGRLSRRDFVVRAAALGVSSSLISAVLAACGAAATATSPPPAAAPTSVPAGGGGATATTAPRPSAAASAVAAGTPGGNTRTGITAAEWNPEAIKANAGTLKVDTKAEVAKLTPL